jgi:hypothetical protein
MAAMVVLAIAGLCFGAGMGAAKQRAPRWMARSCYVASGLAVILAVAVSTGNG